MVRRKFHQRAPSRFKHSRFKNICFSLEDIPLKTMRVTLYALRWVFMLIFLFIIFGIMFLFLTGGQNHVQNIIGYSITGFFTFFMGYFGWILAQNIVEMMVGREEKSEKSLSYYMRKHKNYKY